MIEYFESKHNRLKAKHTETICDAHLKDLLKYFKDRSMHYHTFVSLIEGLSRSIECARNKNKIEKGMGSAAGKNENSYGLL